MKQALLSASRDLFLRFGYRAVSSRQIAGAAGANVAMIRYYFGGKPGLYKQMLENVLVPVRASVAAMLADPKQVDLEKLVRMATRTWANNPWIAGFVIREVLTPEGPMRAVFLREVAGVMAPLLQRIVQSEVERGALRKDLDPVLATLSMISLVVLPYLAFPLTSKVFGVSRTDDFVETLVRHTIQVLDHGIAAREVHS